MELSFLTVTTKQERYSKKARRWKQSLSPCGSTGICSVCNNTAVPHFPIWGIWIVAASQRMATSSSRRKILLLICSSTNSKVSKRLLWQWRNIDIAQTFKLVLARCWEISPDPANKPRPALSATFCSVPGFLSKLLKSWNSTSDRHSTVQSLVRMLWKSDESPIAPWVLWWVFFPKLWRADECKHYQTQFRGRWYWANCQSHWEI